MVQFNAAQLTVWRETVQAVPVVTRGFPECPSLLPASLMLPDALPPICSTFGPKPSRVMVALTTMTAKNMGNLSAHAALEGGDDGKERGSEGAKGETGGTASYLYPWGTAFPSE